MNIGTIDCGTSSSLCKEVGYSDDLVYFKGDIGPGKGEVCFIVLFLCIQSMYSVETFYCGTAL